MAFAVKYRCEFDTIKNRSVKVEILEDGFASTVTDLTAIGQSPLVIQWANGEFDKLTGIRESRFELTVSSLNISASDFLTENDNQYKINVYYNGTLEWVGWLDNDRLQQDFKDTISEIRLTGNDGLSLLKNIELSDNTNAQLWGLYRIKDYIGYCLNKTGLLLSWNSFINMYPVYGGSALDQRGVNADYDVFYYSHLLSHGFLTGPRTFDNCFDILSKICEDFGCTLFQARGEWYIIQINDRIAGDLDATRRVDISLTPSNSVLSNQSFQESIGIYNTFKFKDNNAIISWEKPFKFVKLRYEFQQPVVYFRNFDLQDGTINIPLSTSAREVYNIQYWTEVVSDTYIGVEIDTTNLVEQDRYMLQFPVVPYSDSTVQPRARTSSYYVNEGDKITFGYTTREKNTGFANSQQFNYVILTDGVSTYYLDDDGKWYTSIKTVGYMWNVAEDRRFWKNYSIESDVTPIGGQIYFDLTTIGNSRTASNEVHYKDLVFEINANINNKFNLKGYESKSESNQTIKSDYDKQQFISNSKNVTIRGALLTNAAAVINKYKYYSDADAAAIPFYKYITRAYYKSVYRNYVKLEASLFNLYNTRLISLLNTFVVDEIADKEFMPTTMAIDFRNESSEITLIELRATDTTNDFDKTADVEFFRYIYAYEEVLNDIKEEKKPIDFKFGVLGVLFQLFKRGKRRRFNNYG